MTTESTEPQTDLGPSVAAGQGQSQGHRRRRRRRKNKTTQTGAPQAQQPLQAVAPAPVPVAAPAPPPAAPRRHKVPQAQSSAQPPARKKKTFQKSAPAPISPGNSLSAPHPSKRKTGGGRQKGPREFVGPMDHSYRTANGNVADGPPSTIPTGGNGQGYQENFPAVAPAAPSHDAPTRIFCFIEDLFFLAKIQETARKLGVKVEFVKGDKEVLARLTDLPENERPKLVVFDLNNLNAKPMTLIPKLKSKLKKATSIIGFLSHLQGDLKMKAMEAGCDTVMPRSAFSQSLPNLLRRYGMEEEEDYYPQPV